MSNPARPQLPETGPILIPDLVALGVILLWGLWWLLPGLGHPSIHNWDESFHQAVARGTLDHFPAPTMYAEPFLPLAYKDWWYSGIWMHKATGVFWWAAVMLKVLGITTAALRTASLFSELGIAALLYLVCRPLTGRVIALASALAFLLLPWGWLMTQGHFVADVTDISVTAFVVLGMAWLWWSVEKESLAWAAAAGAAIGVGYLCKTFLSLAPLGVAGAWWFLGRVRFCKGPTFKQVLLMVGAFVAVAAPWNLYAFFHWHDVFARAFDHTIGFISSSSGEDVGPGWRPVDAIFHEINWTILTPFPYPLTLLAGVWLAVKAVRERDGRVIAIALWLWSTWVVHTITHVKGHGHLWNAVPAVFIAYAVTARDVFRYRALAVAVLASLAVWVWKPALAPLLALRAALPSALIQTRTWEHTNLVEQFAFVPLAVLLAWALGRALKKSPALLSRVTVGLGTLAALATSAYAFPISAIDNRKQQAAMDHDRQWSASEDLGLALDPLLEKKAVFFMDTNFDYGVSFEYLNLMFWSGRMVYRMPPNLPMAQERGYHPYEVSPCAEPYEPLDAVPPYAGLRAYDLLKPRPGPTQLPQGLNPLDVQLTNVHAVGWAARTTNERFSRYAFYFEPRGVPTDVRATFTMDDGSRHTETLQVASTLRPAQRVAQSPWCLFQVIGPRHDHVKSIELAQ
ncbi:MAG: glycosyltransferase family 39 protein [Archangiaceae bacterium]|nr:glycosyltransferase family 39 protein [Archangiaceae bacterium]